MIALKPQINGRTARDVDRSGCPADKHGTQWHRKQGCICPDAVEIKRRYEKCYRAAVLPTGRVPIVGTARRLQALAVIGWGLTALARQWDCDFSQLGHWRAAIRPTIHRLNAAFVARNYDVLCDIPGDDSRAVWWATKRGCLSPVQLATFDIDDPVAGPLVRSFVPTGRVDLDEVRYLRGSGESEGDIAARLGVRVRSIQDVERRKDGAA